MVTVNLVMGEPDEVLRCSLKKKTMERGKTEGVKERGGLSTQDIKNSEIVVKKPQSHNI